MPNPHATAAENLLRSASPNAWQTTAQTQALLAVAYELKTQNLLRTAEINADPTTGQALLNDVRVIYRERLSS